MRRGNNPKRSRNPRPGGGGGGGGGRKPPSGNRSLESNSPDGNKVRGNASQLYERYTGLARDAHSAGDRIAAEGYLQYAEHYYRVLNAAIQQQRHNGANGGANGGGNGQSHGNGQGEVDAAGQAMISGAVGDEESADGADEPADPDSAVN